MKNSIKLFALSLLLISCGGSKESSKLPKLPTEAKSFQFFGDSREGNSVFLSLLKIAYGNYPGSDAIHLGDMISNPGQNQELAIVRALVSWYFPPDRFFTTVGNHDVKDELSLSLMASVFPVMGEKGYYAKRIQGCFCIFLNTEDLSREGNTLGPEQKAWLEATLQSEEAQASPYRLVMLHRPLYPKNHHSDEGLVDANELHQLFVQHKVTAVIAGHEHSYSQASRDSVRYIITGGAGSSLIDDGVAGYFHYVQMFERSDRLEFYSIDFRGRIRDEFTLMLP